MIIRCFCGRKIGDVDLEARWIQAFHPNSERRLPPDTRAALGDGDHLFPSWDDVGWVTALFTGTAPAAGEVVLECERHGYMPLPFDEIRRALRHGAKEWKAPKPGVVRRPRLRPGPPPRSTPS